MTAPAPVRFVETDLDALATFDGVIACFVATDGTLGVEARRLNRLTKGAVKRAVDSPAFDKLDAGEVLDLGGRKLEILLVPGHTPDAVALLDSENRLLFTGDTWYDASLWLFARETSLAETSIIPR